jgi:hypothetical protein
LTPQQAAGNYQVKVKNMKRSYLTKVENIFLGPLELNFTNATLGVSSIGI